MLFRTLSGYYEKLEATAKRLELVDILSKLFKEAKADEIGKICYLIQGRVAPFFEPTDMGLAAKELSQRLQTTDYRLQKKKKAVDGRQLTVDEVFSKLLEVAKFTGAGTVEQKVSTLASLLTRLDPISVKHVVNIPLGTLRLGIGDPTVLDALSLAKRGDKSLRPTLESAYNKTSDLGYVAEEFFKKGEAGIKNVHLVVGKPVRPALAERLPSAEEAIKRLGPEFAAEPKFDGFR